MEWGDIENLIVEIGLKKCRMKNGDIYRTLLTLGVGCSFVDRTVKLFGDTGGIAGHPKFGHPCCVQTSRAVKAVKNRIHRNPLRKYQILSREMNISKVSISRIIKYDLGLRAYKRHTGHILRVALKQKGKPKSKALICQYANNDHRKNLFTDEKILAVEESFKKQNDRVNARPSLQANELVLRVLRCHHPASVMIWWGVPYYGVTKLLFCEKGVKTSARVYQSDVLEKVVKPLNSILFKNEPWTFQQVSAPAYKAKTSQD